MAASTATEIQYTVDDLRRTVDFIDSDLTDDNATEISRVFVPLANGSASPWTGIIEALEGEAGGRLIVGIVPIRSCWTYSSRDEGDIRWMRGLIETLDNLDSSDAPLRYKAQAWLDSHDNRTENRMKLLDHFVPGWKRW